MFVSERSQTGNDCTQVLCQQIEGLVGLHCERRIQNILRGSTPMDVTPVLTACPDNLPYERRNRIASMLVLCI